MNFPPTSIATLFRLLRRDGFSFFGKCVRYAFSRDAWLWLLRGGPHVQDSAKAVSAPPDAARAGAASTAAAFGQVPDYPPEERERSRRLLVGYEPKISVVVASYNYAHLIGETLDALEAQTYKNFEVLVIDNASTDNSVEVIKKYADRDPRFKLTVHEVNLGLPGSVKHGVDLATGEFVAFCEADDIWTPDHLEKKVELLREHWGEPDFVINDVELFGDLDRCREVEEKLMRRAPGLAGTRNRLSPAGFRKWNWICTFSCVMVRRSVLHSCDMASVPRPSNLDWWLWRQIAFEHDVWCVHERLTRWRMHKDSYLVRDDSADRWADLYELTARMDRLLVRTHPAHADSLLPYLRPEDRADCIDGKISFLGVPVCQPGFTLVLAADAPEKALSATIESIARQTYRNFELVIAFEKQSGSLPEALSSRLGEVSNPADFRIVSAESAGKTTALEAGVDSASRDWVVPVLPGDMLRPDALQTFAARIVVEPSSNGVFGLARCMAGGGDVGGQDVHVPGLPTGPFACIGTFAFRRTATPVRPSHGKTEFQLVTRLLANPPADFTPHVVLLYDNRPDGRDPGSSQLRTLRNEVLQSRAGTSSSSGKADVDVVRSSPFFDGGWYLENNPDVRQAHVDPAFHYTAHGCEAMRNPGPDFIGDEYFAVNLDVRGFAGNPLVHFERTGRSEGRAISFLQARPGAASSVASMPDCGVVRQLREAHPRSFAAKIEAIRLGRIGKGLPVRALFLVFSPSMFPARPLLDAMLRDAAFDARILVVPDLRWRDRNPEDLRRSCRKELGSFYPADRFLDANADASGEWPDVIGDFGADIVCYPSPYDLSAFRYNPHWAVGRGFLPIYISYSFSTSIHGYEVYGRQNYAYFWKVFVECEANAKEYAEHSILKGANAELTGYFKMDALATAKPWTRNGGRKRVLIAPHHSVQGGANDSLALSNFQRYADYFLALPEKHPELDFVFRPHPFLFTVLANPSKWGQAKVDDWIARMKAHPNVRWSDEGDYFPAFVSCDAIVQDCGSYLAEWAYTGKPCCFMLKTPSDVEAKFTPLGRDILSHCYIAYDEPAIESFLRDVVEGGNDPKAAARDEFRKTVVVNYPHAADVALVSIKRELGIE